MKFPIGNSWLDELHTHALTNSYGYTLKSAGIHVTTAAKLMAHSNPMMTLKVYTQVKDDEAGLAGVAISKFISKTAGPPSLLGGPAV